jgi:hypothetical protein
MGKEMEGVMSMKKMLLIALVAALVAPMTPGHTKVLKKKNVTFSAPVPCTVACPYWMSADGFAAEMNKFANTAQNFDPTTDDPEAFADRGLDAVLSVQGKTEWACPYPGPDVTWDQVRVKAPKGANLLVFEIWPETDWDSFVCTTKNKFLGSGANIVGDCDLGCYERVAIKVKAGRSYLLRAFNWSDAADLRGRYTFMSV